MPPSERASTCSSSSPMGMVAVLIPSVSPETQHYSHLVLLIDKYLLHQILILSIVNQSTEETTK